MYARSSMLLMSLLFAPTFLMGCDNPAPASTSPSITSTTASPEPSGSVPTYKIFEDKSSNSPSVKKVVWSVVATSPLKSKHEVETLVQALYASVSKGIDLNGDDRYVVGFWLYTSEEHAKSGMGQWIAMLTKNNDNPQPVISYNDLQIAHLNDKPEAKFGLSEDQRKEVFSEIVRCEDQADKETEEHYPITMDSLDARNAYHDKLEAQLKKKLAKRSGLNSKQLEDISHEAFNKNWPFPPSE